MLTREPFCFLGRGAGRGAPGAARRAMVVGAAAVLFEAARGAALALALLGAEARCYESLASFGGASSCTETPD